MLELSDRYGRVARDLRVSLTDRCNLRCSYCMPAEGLPWLATEDTLSDAEVVRLLTIAVEMLGVKKLRFTGGEPLLRAGLEAIIGEASQLRTVDGKAPDIALTTNGLGLDRRLPGLIDAGLNRVNISIDSLDPATYALIARRDRLHDVLKSIQAADDAGLTPLKLNAVVLRGINEPDVVRLATFALSKGYELRFIEQMPLGPRHSWDRSSMITAQEILDLLSAKFTLTPAVEPRGAAPAATWTVTPDADQPGGVIGVIASVTAPFCSACDRTRVTSDGQVRSCLFSQRETDLRSLLRSGATDDDIADAWMGEHRIKPRSHGIDDEDFTQPIRTMSAIGG